MALETPFVPTGYSPAQVAAAAAAYAQQRGYRPHMVMQEGHIEERDGVPGTYIKYIDSQGLTTTEWTPLNVPPPPAMSAPAPPQQNVLGALGYHIGGDQVRIPDSRNPEAVKYALMRLGQLDKLHIQHASSGDPTADWRAASATIGAAAKSRGYDNPRDFLAGRKPNHPAPGIGARPSAPQTPPSVGGRPPAPQHPTPGLPGRPSSPKHPIEPVARPHTTPEVRAALAGGARHPAFGSHPAVVKALGSVLRTARPRFQPR